jgi:hypothetical protein
MKNPDKNKKIFKPITADNLYRPKRLTLRNYNRFISPFIDRYNWGHFTSEEDKRFRYSTENIQAIPYKSYLRLREKPRQGYYRDIALSDHLDARKDPEGFVFYTANPFSNLCLLEGDIDPIPNYGYEDCLEACYYIRNQYHPNTYWEPSTTGEGIHFYTIIDFSTFPSDSIKYDVFHRQNCNRIIELYSALLSQVTLVQDKFV